MTLRNTSSVPGPDFKLPDFNPRRVGLVLLLLLLLATAWSSVFTVEPEEVGVVLTFGKYSHQADPDDHLHHGPQLPRSGGREKSR